jgi:NitT/TauT family transport system permease protein
MIASEARLAANPADRLLPAPATIADTAGGSSPNPTGARADPLLVDTGASLARLLMGVAIASAIGLLRASSSGSCRTSAQASPPSSRSLDDPAARGPADPLHRLRAGELSKVVLIVIGITPFLIRDMSQRTLDIPRELLVKAKRSAPPPSSSRSAWRCRRSCRA